MTRSVWFQTTAAVGASAAVGLTVGLTGCDDHLLNGNAPASGIFLADVLEIIDSECISCHAGLTADAGLDLSTDFCAVVNGRIVVPESPETSLLYLRMRSPSEPMPPSGQLSADQINIVRTWISEGADCEGASWVVDDDTGAADPGKQLYDNYCAGCHGADGGGVSAPAMTAIVPGLTAEEVAQIARAGSGTMPPILADPDDAQTLGEWVVAEWGN
ncbi:MAG: hypothetical protein CL927_19570 [Deltaproteobacteria bacterium]|nr:hypothetical protein [Deltaproteobacteria bacterium]HCH65901.1 hypothetical protein [Deltaproteobacteria bacterium]